MIVGWQFASWEFVEKNAISHLSALRTIFLDALQSATAVTASCSSFSVTSLLWWLLMRDTSSAKNATFTVSAAVPPAVGVGLGVGVRILTSWGHAHALVVNGNDELCGQDQGLRMGRRIWRPYSMPR